MPAIELTRLKIQSAKLINLFDQPSDFIMHLKTVLEYYKNRTLRVNPVTVAFNLPSYQTPRPVMMQIEKDLEKLGEQFPSAAIDLVTSLWNASFYESRLLSAFILGTIPPRAAMSVLTNLPEWLYETKDQGIKNALLTTGLARLRKENPQTLLLLISEWLRAPGQKTQTWGLHAFIPLIEVLGFNDLPQFFEVLRPTIKAVSPDTQTDIQACIRKLYLISPAETVHYISEIIDQMSNSKKITEFLRLFRGFPPAMQKELDAEIKKLVRD